MNLRYSMYAATLAGENRHAQTVMKELGITYSTPIPQSVADQWWFLDCENIPEVLPSWITELKLPEGEIERWR